MSSSKHLIAQTWAADMVLSVAVPESVSSVKLHTGRYCVTAENIMKYSTTSISNG